MSLQERPVPTQEAGKTPESFGAEKLKTPEQIYKLKAPILAISGRSSSGNTSTADGAAARYGVPNERVYHAGSQFRKYKEETDPEHYDKDSLKYIERPISLDLRINQEMIDLFMSATLENPVIVEGKLAGAELRYIELQIRDAKLRGESVQELPSPRIAALKYAISRKRYQIARAKKGRELTAKEIQTQTAERDDLDIEQWSEATPWLIGYHDYLGKNARDNEGTPLYQVIIDTSDHGPGWDLDYLDGQLLRLGIITPIEHPLVKDQVTIIPRKPGFFEKAASVFGWDKSNPKSAGPGDQ